MGFLYTNRMRATTVLVILLLSAHAPRLAAESPCAIPAASATAIEGSAELKRARADLWAALVAGTPICPGDRVRVGHPGRVLLVLSDETLVRLDAGTTLQFPADDAGKDSALDLVEGAAHFISRTRRGLKIKTPFVNAGIEGTEFVVRVAAGDATVWVIEGTVVTENEHGVLPVRDGEAVRAGPDTAPMRYLEVAPRDAVRWALYYPVLADPRALPADTALRYEAGDLAGALATLESVPVPRRDAGFLAARAGMRLGIGQVALAEVDLAEIERLAPNDANARALRAVIAISRDDKDTALRLAETAAGADASAPVPQTALSYVHQARFELDLALAAAVRAADLVPDNAIAPLRVAELALMQEQPDRALAAAERAMARNPRLGRGHALLGFARLAAFEFKHARAAFERAVELDSADPLAHLGSGLARIRDGQLAAGRREIEIAAALDPGSSLLRSYLGKAYYEERRHAPSADQYALAKRLDPGDPTPWFYDALRKQTENRPVEALADLERSIALNDRRAVYRSRLLLDQDLAARGASLARIYTDLGFGQRALVEGWKSVNTDPGNYSAHRFLADAYAALPRHEVARVSEVLQAQLLQPLNINPVPPQIVESNLGILEGAGPSSPGYNEFTPLFARDQVAFQANALAGSDDTRAGDVAVAGINGRASWSVGGHRFESDGFRANNQLEQNLGYGFAQYQFGARTGIQMEVRRGQRNNGDLSRHFDPAQFSATRSEREDTDTIRFGLHHTPNERSHWLLSAQSRSRDMRAQQTETFFSLSQVDDDDGRIIEGQQQGRYGQLSWITGAGTVRLDQVREAVVDVPVPATSFTDLQRVEIKQDNLYTYVNRQWGGATGTAGLSVNAGDDGLRDETVWNPKLGIHWDIHPAVALRAAAFRVVKRDLVADQTIEPTQVAGFNQFYDDNTGTVSEQLGVALDAHPAPGWYGGAELTQRDLKVPYQDFLIGNREADWQESIARAYLYHAPTPWLALSAELQAERLQQSDDFTTGILDLKTLRAPLSLRWFCPRGLSADLTVTWVDQQGVFLDTGTLARSTGSDDVWLTDLALRYRLPRRHGIFSAGVQNLFDRAYFYEETDPDNPRLAPARFSYARLSLSF